MNFDGILAIITLLFYWRVALSILVSSILAYLLVWIFPWLSGLQGIVLASLGFAFGLIWEEKIDMARYAKKNAAPTQQALPDLQTSAAVAGSTAAIIGAVWGIFSASSNASIFAGVIIFLLSSKIWTWHVSVRHQWFSKNRSNLCAIIAGLAYPVGVLMGKAML